MTAEDNWNWKQYTQDINGTHIYVQRYGCVELSQGGDPDEPELVHICSDNWALVVAAANKLLAMRGEEELAVHVSEWWENAARMAEKAHAEGAATFMALCPDGHIRDLLQVHQEGTEA